MVHLLPLSHETSAGPYIRRFAPSNSHYSTVLSHSPPRRMGRQQPILWWIILLTG